MPRINKTDWLLESLMGPVTLFNNLPIMAEAVARFWRHDYIVHEFDCAQQESQEMMFNAVLHSTGCLKEDHFYKNIQTIQFWDLLRDIRISEESGVVLAFKNFDDFHRRLPESGQQMLSSIALEHFYELRRGLRLLTLAHSNERNLELEPLVTSAPIGTSTIPLQKKSISGRHDFKSIGRLKRQCRSGSALVSSQDYEESFQKPFSM